MNICLYIHDYKFQLKKNQHERIYQKERPENHRHTGRWNRRVCILSFCRLYERHMPNHLKPVYQYCVRSTDGLSGIWNV